MNKALSRKIIYLLILISLSIPLLSNFVLRPAEMTTADDTYAMVKNLNSNENKFVLISMDFGPSTSAENGPQAKTLIEHLMRRRIPFGVITTYPYAAPFLESYPQQVADKLTKEMPSENWKYGVDWVNLGFKPNGAAMIQGIAKAKDIHEIFRADGKGADISTISCMSKIHTINNITMLAQITGLVGVFNTWIQFFQTDDYRPEVIHGCTAITIPEAYIYYATGQIKGFYEGVAGAAWYDTLLSKDYPSRIPTDAPKVNTSLATAHLVILGLIILGNLLTLLERFRRKS